MEPSTSILTQQRFTSFTSNTLGCAGYDTKLCGGMNMDGMWHALFWMIPIWIFLLIPFMTFYYEADEGMIMAGTSVNPEGKRQSKIWQALCYEFFVVVIVL
jgi:TM2 domain-containing membrane protein YozV